MLHAGNKEGAQPLASDTEPPAQDQTKPKDTLDEFTFFHRLPSTRSSENPLFDLQHNPSPGPKLFGTCEKADPFKSSTNGSFHHGPQSINCLAEQSIGC